MIRFNDIRYSTDEVFNFLPIQTKSKSAIKLEIKHGNREIKLFQNFHGANVSIYSDRYVIFRKSIKCQRCGLIGLFFYIETSDQAYLQNKWHFNLYGLDKDGNEILFTKDHIVPKSKCGKNTLNNYQTMCVRCNREKGNTYENSDN